MKLAIRFGMPITVGVMLWTIIAHSLVPNPQSIVHSLGAFTFFNILQFTCIFLGLKALEREQRTKPTFKTCLKQGVSISFVYAVTSALFFVGVLLIIGTKWMGAEVGVGVPKWVYILQAFAGLVVLSMLFGLVYSTVISFVLAKRLSHDN
jgi:hypothetical protein